MTSARLALPTAPPPVPVLDVVDPLLAWAGAARERPFRVAGRRAAALGTERRGVTATQADGVLLTGPIRLVEGDGGPIPAANVMHGPRLLRRELVAAGVTLSETLVMPEGLPGLLLQWRGAGGRGWRGRVEIDLPPTADGRSRHLSEGGTLRVAGGEDDPAGCVLHMQPTVAWRLVERPTRRAVADVTFEPGAAVTLLVAAIDRSGRPPALATLAAAEAHLRRADHDVAHAPGLRVRTGVAEIDDGVAWARATVRAAAGRAGAPPMSPSPEAFEGAGLLLAADATVAWTVMGALATGELEAARDLLPELGDHPLDAWALSEWVAWTGEGDPLRAARERVEGAVRRASDPGLQRLLGARLGDAAEAAGDPVWAGALRAAGTGPAPATLPRGAAAGGVRLPSLRGGAAGSLVAAALGVDPEGPPPRPPPPDDPADPALPLLAAALYTVGEPDEAFTLLRPALAAPVRDGPQVGALASALVARAFTGGLLGARPDATFGRLAFAPALPAFWNRFAAEGFRVGDATLDLDYVRDGDHHTWRFRPTAGAVPLMLVLEPVLPLARVVAVHVDGQPAEVDATPRRGRMVVRLQLALDAERSLTVEGSGPEGT